MSTQSASKLLRATRRRTKRRRHSSRDDRRGAAIVEFAICLPVLVAVTLAFIDLTNLIYFRQTIKIACYDAARAAAEASADAQSVQDTADRLLSMRGVENYELTLPDDFDTIPRGSIVNVELAVPLSEMTSFSGMDLWEDSLDNGVTIETSIIKE
ncbi:MAG TPA: hypothetical protein DDW52_12875 [Planctomycetaceae bacterium]|nr:hypothetical protein [Planctomycetaceae bacterium]